MKIKVVLGIMLTLLLTLTLGTVLVTPAAAYPFEDIFKKDLLDIANSVPQIEVIYIKSWLDFRPSDHLWACIRINYTAGLSDWEKISIQDYVHYQLASKWYIAIVERNYYAVILIYPTPPVPWPGFVIGDLNVAFKTPIRAVVNINPSTLNLKSKGEWITAYIELPEDYNVSDIDIYSIRLNDTFPISLLVDPPVLVPTEIGDHDSDNVPDLMVKFNRTEVASWIYNDLGIQYGNVTLTITGEVDGTPFEGTDTIKVLFPGDVDDDGDVDGVDYYLFAGAYGTNLSDAVYNWAADFNEDGSIDGEDYYILAGNYGKTAI